MAAWQTSSLAFSDHNNMRNGHGLLKNLPTRISKQHIVEQKMFGAKRKGIQIGKKFKKIGKGISSKASSGAMMPGDMKAKGISPSIAEFDKMMAGVVGKGGKKSNGFSKKPSFSRKSFG
jgi:hypothetical protein